MISLQLSHFTHRPSGILTFFSVTKSFFFLNHAIYVSVFGVGGSDSVRVYRSSQLADEDLRLSRTLEERPHQRAAHYHAVRDLRHGPRVLGLRNAEPDRDGLLRRLPNKAQVLGEPLIQF